MPFDVCLFLDGRTEDEVRRVWRVLRTRGISSPLIRSGGRPHLTLAIWEELDPDPRLLALSELAGKTAAFPVTFSAVGTFGPGSGTVFLSPSVGRELVTVHERLYRIMYDLAGSSEGLYRPGSWVPHCSLSLETPDHLLGRALVESLEALELPLRGSIEALGIIGFGEESAVSYRSFPLSGR